MPWAQKRITVLFNWNHSRYESLSGEERLPSGHQFFTTLSMKNAVRWCPYRMFYPISDVLNEIRSFSYRSATACFHLNTSCFKGVNDTPRHIKETCPYSEWHRMPDQPDPFFILFQEPPLEGFRFRGTIALFNLTLNRKGILTTTRASRGMDIYAACGMLSTKELIPPKA